MGDDKEIAYRITVWFNGTKYDWEYTVPCNAIDDRYRISNKRVPVDHWPDPISGTGTKTLEGCEFVATNDRGDGMSGLIDKLENHGTVIKLDTSFGGPRYGDDFPG